MLKGHVSEETAYLVDDYPYGFRLRTQIRYWIETKPRKGDRFVAQTLNPKTNKWNKPKRGTYSAILVMWLNEDNHVKHSGLSGRGWATQEGIDAPIEFIGDHELNEHQQNELKVARAILETNKHVTVTTTNTTNLTKEERAIKDKEQEENRKQVGKLFGYNLHKEGATY